MTETPAEKKAQYWCYDGSSWRLIDDPLPPEFSWTSLSELHGKAGFELLLGPGEPGDDSAHISLWARKSEPQCLIDIFHGGDVDGLATVYADRLPDGIDLFARWAPAVYGHGGEPDPTTGEGENGGTGR